jgi:hypothetical protein
LGTEKERAALGTGKENFIGVGVGIGIGKDKTTGEMLGTGKESVWVWGCVGGKEKKLKC